MKLVIEISMDNAAFEEGNVFEAARILNDLVDKLVPQYDIDAGSAGILRDKNGNRVGQWKVTEEES